jgi:hypothetical protein
VPWEQITAFRKEMQQVVSNGGWSPMETLYTRLPSPWLATIQAALLLTMK